MTLADFERKARAGEPPDFHLRRMETLLGLMGDPHLKVRTLHVAGTKGKGSTCAMLSSVLSAHGARTGLYTSPHLHTFRERIQVDSKPISEEHFACLVADLWTHVDAVAAMGDRGTVTVFELLTAMAFEHFLRSGCEFQVIEVGLGGRLDATNLVRPDVAVITPVGLDHVAVLGDTIPKIAAEKAGIIKPGAPTVVGRQVPEAMAVIARKASEAGSVVVDAMAATKLCGEPKLAGDRQQLVVESLMSTYQVDLPLLGMHQADNARTAIAALEALSAVAPSTRTAAVPGTNGARGADGHGGPHGSGGFALRKEAVEKGLSATVWPGRFQVLSHTGLAGPAIVVDGAHNADSAEALRSTFESRFASRRGRVILIYGGTRGHDSTETARRLASLRPVVITTRTRHPKAVDPVELAVALRGLELDVAAVSPSTQAAYAAALAMAEPDDVILAAGSLFVAAEVIEQVQGIRPEVYPTLKGDMMPTITATGV